MVYTKVITWKEKMLVLGQTMLGLIIFFKVHHFIKNIEGFVGGVSSLDYIKQMLGL